MIAPMRTCRRMALLVCSEGWYLPTERILAVPCAEHVAELLGKAAAAAGDDADFVKQANPMDMEQQTSGDISME